MALSKFPTTVPLLISANAVWGPRLRTVDLISWSLPGRRQACGYLYRTGMLSAEGMCGGSRPFQGTKAHGVRRRISSATICLT